MIEMENVSKVYPIGDTDIRALDHVTFRIGKGELVAIMGASGSGKSTLLAILGCLDAASSGVYRLDGDSVAQLSDQQLARLRSQKIGFVFQQFNLLARTNALENVMLPLTYSGVRGHERRERAAAALATVGLGDRLHHRPNELSGGQQQRVAIARALVNRPAILLADEPTGALDSKTGAEIIGLFQRLHRDFGQTTIFVTHDPVIARHTHRIVRLSDGQIVSDDRVKQPLAADGPRPASPAVSEGQLP